MPLKILFALALSCLGLSAAEKPNFLVIFADDLGFGDVSTYHPSDCHTPNIDRLAAGGLLFTDMRANCTVCSPSRASLLTGKYPDRVGVPGVIRTKKNNNWGYFDPACETLASALKPAGYRSALIGKWHLGLEPENHPNARAFDFFHGFLGDMMEDYYTHMREGHNYMRLNEKTIDPEGHATDIFSDWARAYLEERAQKKDGPFFLYLAYNAPHFPIQPPPAWLAKIKKRNPKLSEKRAKNVALVEHLDHNIGRVLDTLEKSGLARNTLVVFASDNGGSLSHAQNNDPWRGGKQSHFDGGLRSPFIMSWPGTIEAGRKSAYPGLNFDIFPTFLELAGLKVPAGLDARSLLPLMKGEKMSGEREFYFVRREGGEKYGGMAYHALIRGDWKILRNDSFSPLELYNLAKDPGEKNNLAREKPEVLRELSTRLCRHIQRGGEVPWQDTER